LHSLSAQTSVSGSSGSFSALAEATAGCDPSRAQPHVIKLVAYVIKVGGSRDQAVAHSSSLKWPRHPSTNLLVPVLYAQPPSLHLDLSPLLDST
jgi:hypothetical protein